jgi:hypothetical protein
VSSKQPTIGAQGTAGSEKSIRSRRRYLAHHERIPSAAGLEARCALDAEAERGREVLVAHGSSPPSAGEASP